MNFAIVFRNSLFIFGAIFNYNLLQQAASPTFASSSPPSISSPQINHEYWTAYIDIKHVTVNKTTRKRKFYSDTSETGVFLSRNATNIHGVAVIMRSNENDPRKSSTVIDSEDARSNSGCFPPFLKNYPNDEPWIAVARNGQCSIRDKVRNALGLNASGILIYDDKEDQPLYSMKGMINVRN